MRNYYYTNILHFWFKEIPQKYWWVKDSEFDLKIKQRFENLLEMAIKGELVHWRETAEGSLAEILILDQFSRNIHRDSPKAFSQDPQALSLAQRMIEVKQDRALSKTMRLFAYLPFMHSESKQIHEQAVEIFTDLGLKENLEFEMKHKVIIDKFGRYPHRNNILGRESTPAEIEFLSQPGSSF